MGIIIPKRFLTKLENNDETYSGEKTWLVKVNNSISQVNKILDSGRAPSFFIEYTDHGVKHINNVLFIADKLIPDETLNAISAKTMAIIIMGILLHDIGMFVNYESFQCMLSHNIKIEPLDKEGMNDLWKKYLLELSRYSEQKLMDCFGTTEIDFKSLPKDKGTMSDYDKMVVGEFLRRNHHKISHYLINGDITIDGQVRSDINKLFNHDDFSDSEIYFIGMVARSHGEDIRKFETSFNTYVNRKSPDKVDVFYAMSVLSISDLLDGGEERASHIIQSIYVSYSEISAGEFQWNQCFSFPSSYEWNMDEKCLIITAFPKNAFQFSKTKKWLSYVQVMLDQSWSIINEFYNKKDLHFSIYRVKSNLFIDEFIEETKKQFYPEEIHFNANPDITKLLIQPLYGYDPSFGIRELLQNSLDACRERKVIENENNNDRYTESIKIDLDTNNKVFRITDNGIGMTSDIIINYYLTAGASLINSEYWNTTFINDNNLSKIARNGRFGIGVLSSFLIGDEVTVTTRSMFENDGWKFTFSREPSNIELLRTQCEIGTEICVTIKDDALEQLEYNPRNIKNNLGNISWNNWYYQGLDDSMVNYHYNGETIIDYRKERSDDTHWHIIDDDRLQYFGWCEKSGPGYYSVYNSLIVPDFLFEISETHYFFINVIDRDNIVSLNLNRTKFFDDSLKKTVLYDYFKYQLFIDVLLVKSQYFDCVFSNKHFIAQFEPFYKYFNINKVYMLYNVTHISDEIRNFYCTLDSYNYRHDHEWERMNNIRNYVSFISKQCDEEFLSKVKRELDNSHEFVETERFYVVNKQGSNLKEPVFNLYGKNSFACEKNIVSKGIFKSDEIEIAFEVYNKYIPKKGLADNLIPIDIEERVSLFRDSYKNELAYINSILDSIDPLERFRYYSIDEITELLDK